MRTKPRIAIIAHDAKRDELVEVLREFLPELRRCELVATQVTGTVCSQSLDIEVALVESSVRGGDMQIGAMVSENRLDAVIYMRDALAAIPFGPDERLIRVCDIHRLPVATNAASARAVLAYMIGWTYSGATCNHLEGPSALK